MFKHILVATDGSALADKAVAAALRLSADCGARLRHA
jgi:nucleotide-binding universal stress UspA family protein